MRKELEALTAQVNKGELKEPDKIGAAAAHKLARHHGHRYYTWELQRGKFRFFEHPLNLPREKALEGKYVIQTEEQNLSALEVVARYKLRSYKSLKCQRTRNLTYRMPPEWLLIPVL